MAITDIAQVDAAIAEAVTELKILIDDYKKSTDELLASKANAEEFKELIVESGGSTDQKIKDLLGEIERLKVEKTVKSETLKAKGLL